MIQATLLLACAWCAAKALHRRSSAEQHVLWAAALGAAALIPLLSVLLATWQPAWARTVAEILPTIVRPASSAISPAEVDIVVHAGALESGTSSFVRAVAIVWAMGTTVALIALLGERCGLRGSRSWRDRPATSRGSD